MKRTDINQNDVSPMMRQYLEIKNKHEDAILFFRLGDFYEMFFEDAEIASRELELVLTGRNASLKERVPMCGIPYHASSSYISKLVDKGYKVAICEQVSEAKKGEMVSREVVEIITKGTYLNNETDNNSNYLASVYSFKDIISTALCDVNTGDFYTKSFNDTDSLISFLIKEEVSEVIINNNLKEGAVRKLKNNNVYVSTYIKISNNFNYVYKNLNVYEKQAAMLLISYLEETKKKDLSHLNIAKELKEVDTLLFDDKTINNLELISSKKSVKNSLLWYLNYTQTAMGYRLLKHNILNPLVKENEITYRYDLIDNITKDYLQSEKLKELLKNVYDIEKITSKISMNTANIKDLISLKNSIGIIDDLNNILFYFNFNEKLYELNELYDKLNNALNEDVSSFLGEGKIFKKGYHKELDEIIDIKKSSKKYLLELEQQEKEKTGIKNLKIGFNKVFGYYIEISKGSIKDLKDEFGYIRKQTLTNGERFITEELKEKENIILNAEDNIYKIEKTLFEEIRLFTSNYLNKLKHNAKVIAFVDMMFSLSSCALDNKLIRPQINNDRILELIESKHPVVEKNTNEFVPNDIIMDNKCSTLLITGPNMAGKSTYMRQVALNVIMAQIGSYVPCKKMTYQIFDKIFTRIGASDDLNSGDSTFMLEMKEASFAIKNSTDKSLILFDELGRGTSTYDGMALARAILEFIHDNIKCKTLFSTHYHELTRLDDYLKELKNVHVDVSEENGDITFLYKVKAGEALKSYGIHVARLAGLNNSIINRANKILQELENQESKVLNKQITFDLDLKDNKNYDDIIEQISKYDLLNSSPLDALNFISKIKDEISKK